VADWIINEDTGLIFPANIYNKDAKGCRRYNPTAAEIVAGKALRGADEPIFPSAPSAVQAPAPVAQETAEVEVPKAPEEPPQEMDPEMVKAIERMAAIREVVAGIAPEFYAKPAGGRPAMPKVEAVSSLTGFKVSVEEILDAMKGLRLIP